MAIPETYLKLGIAAFKEASYHIDEYVRVSELSDTDVEMFVEEVIGSVNGIELIKPLYLDGITYTPEVIEFLRRDLIEMRKKAMYDNDFTSSLSLSHSIAALDHLAKNTESGT